VSLVPGILGLGTVLAVALLGPLVMPYNPNETVATPYEPPSSSYRLGTDFLGRDVVSRVLDGGHTVLLYASIATVVAYALGITLGLVAGYRRGWVDQVIMRTVDVLLAFPSLVFLLLLAAAFGRGIGPVVWATALIQATAIARIVRTAALEQSVRGFVEAAVARGDRTRSVLFREILPNLYGTLGADLGLRFTWSVLLIASVNFLGLGMQPPGADWGLMVSENRGGLSLNAMAVLAPAAALGLLTVSVNLVTDALIRRDA
jgi:ABC-type dipeptide/oligopeptide/nickel transport system permease subunit